MAAVKTAIVDRVLPEKEKTQDEHLLLRRHSGRKALSVWIEETSQ